MVKCTLVYVDEGKCEGDICI